MMMVEYTASTIDGTDCSSALENCAVDVPAFSCWSPTCIWRETDKTKKRGRRRFRSDSKTQTVPCQHPA